MPASGISRTLFTLMGRLSMKNGKCTWKSSDKKIPAENLQEFLQFKRRGSKSPDKKKYQRRDKHHKEDVQW